MAQNIDYCTKKVETNEDVENRKDKCCETE